MSEWIKLKKHEAPDPFKDVLTYSASDGIIFHKYEKAKDRYWGKVTHWMHLPKPPEVNDG